MRSDQIQALADYAQVITVAKRTAPIAGHPGSRGGPSRDEDDNAAVARL